MHFETLFLVDFIKNLIVRYHYDPLIIFDWQKFPPHYELCKKKPVNNCD
ncbi:MAG: hypothetical protein WBQ73_00100 [Candidatus Babeliales bacterium]